MAGSSADEMSHGDSYVLAERTITPKYPGGRDLASFGISSAVDQDELHLLTQVSRHLHELGLAVTGEDDPPDFLASASRVCASWGPG